MSKLLNILIVLVIIGFLLVKFVFNRTVSVGTSAPSIEATLLNGQDFQLTDLRGQYVLIDFWGSWCPPCRKQNRELVPFYKKYENAEFEDADGFQMLSIAIEKRKEQADKAIKKDNLYWDYHIVQESKLVLKAPLALKYGITDLPTTILINPEGNIMATNFHVDELDKLLSKRLKN